MDLSELDISVIEGIGNQQYDDEKSPAPSVSDIPSIDEEDVIEQELVDVPIDGDAFSANESENENSDIVQFTRLEPSRYNRSSFDIGMLIRFAGLEKDKWHWGG